MCCYLFIPSFKKGVLKENSIYLFLIGSLFLAQTMVSRSDYFLNTQGCQSHHKVLYWAS